jgi:hypothetical protein
MNDLSKWQETADEDITKARGLTTQCSFVFCDPFLQFPDSFLNILNPGFGFRKLCGNLRTFFRVLAGSKKGTDMTSAYLEIFKSARRFAVSFIISH